MAGSRTFAELRARMSPEAQAKAATDAERLDEEMDLGEVRRALKLSQDEIGHAPTHARLGRQDRPCIVSRRHKTN